MTTQKQKTAIDHKEQNTMQETFSPLALWTLNAEEMNTLVRDHGTSPLPCSGDKMLRHKLKVRNEEEAMNEAWTRAGMLNRDALMGTSHMDRPSR